MIIVNDPHQSSSLLLNWPILHRLKHSFLQQIQSFLVYGDRGTEVLIITANETIYTFGENNRWPSLPLGHRERIDGEKPEEIVEFRNQKIIDIVYGQRHVMAVTELGECYSWGDNRFGQLGNNTFFESLKPILVGNHIQSLACGSYHTLALTNTGQVFAWGRNNYGQIGIGSNNDQLIPVKISSLDSENIHMIKCGSSHSFAVTDHGKLYGWGGNSFGQLGIGNCTHQSVPTMVKFSNDVPVKSIACGEYHTLILMITGEIYSCGRNDQWQLGCTQISSSEGSLIPVRISCKDRFESIASHFATNFSAAISTSGYCYVWGDCVQPGEQQPHHNHHQQTDIDVERPSPPIREPRQTPLISIHDAFIHYCRKRITPFLYDLDHEERIRMRTVGSRLVEKLRQSFNDQATSDIEFIIDGQSIYVHQWFLQLSSQYLNRMLSDEWMETAMIMDKNEYDSADVQNNGQQKQEKIRKKIELHTYSYEVFYAYLRYLYTDILEFAESSSTQQTLIELLDLANCYLDTDLKQKCINMMRHNLCITNCCDYYQLAIRYQLVDFEKEIIIFAYNNIFEICRSNGFKSMSGDLCKSLLVAISEMA
ncbi:RCC1 and BTB domain-containing protein 1 [Dermatophagoides farinae]|uniref:RCC1 and BTB domain-containing protein 1 n=2 Tax=Dermatophagoides farinae TaxID=6954 RepID=A0A922HRW0_DERFA|nr:RCC1 and BTB domain-containing protein 1 [Dermatophagoides farinae]